MTAIERAATALRYALAMLLLTDLLGSLMTAAINPEIWFFGEKLEGLGALRILMLEIPVTAGVLLLLITKRRIGAAASLALFLFNTLACLNSFGTLTLSPLYTTGLLLSALLVILEWRIP